MQPDRERIARETHQLTSRQEPGGQRWLVCVRCRVAWPAGWGMDVLPPCEAANWGR